MRGDAASVRIEFFIELRSPKAPYSFSVWSAELQKLIKQLPDRAGSAGVLTDPKEALY